MISRHAPSRLEQDSRAEAQDAIRNLVLMLASLTMCGHTELKPSQASMGSLFQMLGFTLPQPSNRGINIPIYDFKFFLLLFNSCYLSCYLIKCYLIKHNKVSYLIKLFNKA